jgi:hypothetical protein
MEQSPAILRATRQTTGLSLRRWAAELKSKGHPYSHVALSYYETGTREIPDGLLQMYEETAAAQSEPATASSTDLTTELIMLGRPDVDRRKFLRGAAYSAAATALPTAFAPAATGNNTIGTVDVEAVRAWVGAFADLDERFGGAFGRSAVGAFCASDVPAKLQGRFATDQIRRDMLGACAEAVYLAGWKAHDVGDNTLARRYYGHAYAIAAAADPGPHAAWVMRIICHQAFALGHGAGHINMAEEACRRVRGRVDPHTEALFTITAARAHAAAGNHRNAIAAIAITESQMQRTPDEPPRWAASSGPAGGPPLARIHNQIGVTLKALGDHTGAEEKARHGLALWNRDTNPRIWAITAARIAQAQYDQGNLADAQDTWRTILPILDGIDSARIAKTRTTAEAHLAQS